MSDPVVLPEGWHFVRERGLIFDPARGILAAVRGSAADGVLMASAQRLRTALDRLERSAGALLASDQIPSPDIVAELVAARSAAALVLRDAADQTEH